MTSQQLKAKFDQVYNGPNFLTPEILSYHELGDLGAELSCGTGLSMRFIFSIDRFTTRNLPDLFGVSVISGLQGGAPKQERDLSEMFESEATAKAYIETLRNGETT